MSTQAQATEGRVHYSRAPILEAVIDIHARLPHDVDLEALSRVSWGVAGGRYSSPQPRFRNDILVQGDSQPPVVSAAQVQVGFIFRDDERKQVVQSRIDGFALSQLAPYDRWESFCHDARFLWDAYCDAARPLGVTRIAVRYINRLELPHPLEDFREYLRTRPEVSPDLPQGLRGFVLQLQIPQQDIIDGMLVLNEGLMESASPNTAAILLDIDLFQLTVLPTRGDDLWSALEALHRRKNDVFESCITDKMRELIR